MERFVQAIVGGGLALVAGLWVATLFTDVVGWGLVLVGISGLGWGIWQKVEQ